MKGAASRPVRIAAAGGPILEVLSQVRSARSTLERHPRASIDVTESIAYFDVIALTINGWQSSFPAPLNVADLIEQLELQGKRIALERNGEIIPRSLFGAMELNDGDALEIVVAVGGG